jgi:hypothetical protein
MNQINFHGTWLLLECLTRQWLPILCTLFTGLCIGSTCDLSFFLWSSANIWIMVAIVWWRSFGLSSNRVAGANRLESKMIRFYTLSFFVGWSMFCNFMRSMSCNLLWYYNFVIKEAVCIILMQKLGVRSPIRKKTSKRSILPKICSCGTESCCANTCCTIAFSARACFEFATRWHAYFQMQHEPLLQNP